MGGNPKPNDYYEWHDLTIFTECYSTSNGILLFIHPNVPSGAVFGTIPIKNGYFSGTGSVPSVPIKYTVCHVCLAVGGLGMPENCPEVMFANSIEDVKSKYSELDFSPYSGWGPFGINDACYGVRI